MFKGQIKCKQTHTRVLKDEFTLPETYSKIILKIIGTISVPFAVIYLAPNLVVHMIFLFPKCFKRHSLFKTAQFTFLTPYDVCIVRISPKFSIALCDIYTQNLLSYCCKSDFWLQVALWRHNPVCLRYFFSPDFLYNIIRQDNPSWH